MSLSTIWRLLKEAGIDWLDDECPRWGAALAFYSVLSLAPLLVIAIAIAGAVFGDEAARGEVVTQMQSLMGKDGAEAIQQMILHAQKPATGSVAASIGVVVLLLGASGVFGELRAALNRIWEVDRKPGGGVMSYVKDRFLSVTMVLGTGFLLLVSLALSAFLQGAQTYFVARFPELVAMAHIADVGISFGVTMILFALIYKFVPDVRVVWKDVWIGAATTAALFIIGKFLLGFYLGRGTFGSAYGAAGSLVVMVVWVYYSAQIMFFGAELTQVYARQFGADIKSDQALVQPSDSITINYADGAD
ncbi:MAG TPA: YihY/virulence factor BrkB family protein [Xanthobacteraceae bacterium]|nr:YihY/virulence factor BrkB family protein [Xanthobacteraceae bacterium]